MAAVVLGDPLPRSRPLWSATFVTGLADGGTGLVIVMNHVLADGIGGLAILSSLVDESASLPPAGPPAVPFPVPAPRVAALAADAWAGRARRPTARHVAVGIVCWGTRLAATLRTPAWRAPAADRPLLFFGWIVALVTAIAVIFPFSTTAALDAKIVTALVSLAIGVATGTLADGVAVRSAPGARLG
jgi:Wax ester synthase-like Acyl-CoA acyltransferase domain